MFEQTINHLSQIYNRYVYPDYTDIKSLEHVRQKNFYYFFVKGHKRDEITKVFDILKKERANCFIKNINHLESIQNEDKIDFFFFPSHTDKDPLFFHNRIIKNLFETRKLSERIMYTNQEPTLLTSSQEGLHMIKRHKKQDLFSNQSLKETKEKEFRNMLQTAAEAMKRLDMAAEEKTM